MSENTRKGDDTHLGGLSKEFPRTTAGLLDQLRHPFGPDGRAGLEELCRRYWKPVYSFIRIGWAKSNEDAKDLTQAFFAWLLEGDVLSRYQKERAAFRRFLKALVKGFLSETHRASKRIKRGGETKFLRFDDEDCSFEEVLADPRAADPEKAFDQAWLVALMKHAVDRVRGRFQAAQFRVFEEHALSQEATRPTYAEIATRLGMKESQVHDTLVAVHRELRKEIQVEIARQTGSQEEFEEEWNALFGA